MTGETWAVLGVGVALVAVIVPTLRAMRRDVGALGERVAGIEGFLRGQGVAPEAGE